MADMVVKTDVAMPSGRKHPDLVATVPERFAMRCTQPFGLVYVPHPAPLPEIAIKLFWHAKYHRDPANRWLRQLLFDHFGETSESSGEASA